MVLIEVPVRLQPLVSRAVFARVYLTAIGRLKDALKRRIAAEPLGPNVATDPSQLDAFIVALSAFELLKGGNASLSSRRYSVILPKVYAATVVARGLRVRLEMNCLFSVAYRMPPHVMSFPRKRESMEPPGLPRSRE